MKPGKKGFTLTELLIVVLVMGILAAIATPLYLRTIKKSRASDALNVLTAAAERQESYFINNGKYAAGFTELGAPVKGLEGDKTTTTNGVKVGNFKYQMSDSCVSAVSLTGNQSSDEDDYAIYKNFVTQQEGCVGKGCEVLEGIIDHVSSVGCPPVVVVKENEDPGSGTDPCIANPALCCPSGTTWNGTKCVGMECETGKVYDSLKKACVCAIQCASGLGVLNESNCTCTCSNTCSGGQVIDAGCNCSCPSNMPNWNAATSSCAPTCPSPKTRWNGAECVCPLDAPLFTGSACVACPVSKPWNGTQCACPSELPYEWGGKCMACYQSSYNSLKAACESTQYGPAGTWTGVMCSCDCREENSIFKNGHCTCPTSKPNWTGSACEACPSDKPWDGTKCSCPSDKPYEYSGTCNKCQQTEDLSNGICCPAGTVSTDGITCADPAKALTPKRVNINVLANCHEDNEVGWNGKAPASCRVTKKGYFIGGSLPYVASTVTTHKYGMWPFKKKCKDGAEAHTSYYYGGTWWNGGTQVYPQGQCNGSKTDQEICNANCTSKPCSYTCLISENVPSSCSSYYHYYSFYGHCEGCLDRTACDNTSGSAVILTCV